MDEYTGLPRKRQAQGGNLAPNNANIISLSNNSSLDQNGQGAIIQLYLIA